MTCKKIRVGRHSTSEGLRKQGEGSDFIRLNLEGCSQDLNLDVFTKNGKTCVSVVDKTGEKEYEQCLE